MFDCNALMLKFYDDHVRLGDDRRAVLAGHRDKNLERLETGLGKLGLKNGQTYASFNAHYDQGSYAMKTLNQHPNNDYDIDEGVIFKKEDLPSSPLDARKRVADAMKEAGGNFSKEPEARTNAVTIWYAEGHHVDFAVYRSYLENGILVFEHAGPVWKKRNPLEINAWFQARVDTMSPRSAAGATVRPSQLRRMVKLVKAFTRSRTSWDLPGGMITTAIVIECYQPDSYRDDIAFVKTLRAMRSRLRLSSVIMSPVEPGAVLTSKPEWAGQVGRLLGRIEEGLPDLDILDGLECDQESARGAWYSFFAHPYWAKKETFADKTSATTVPSSTAVTVRDVGEEFLSDYGIREQLRYKLLIDGIVQQDGWRPFALKGSREPLRKQRKINFKVVSCEVPEPYVVKWKVKNTGAEARRRGDLRGKIIDDRGGLERNENTKYEGEHYVECYAIKDGICMAKARIDVPIGTL